MKFQKTQIAVACALISAAPFAAHAAPSVSFKTPLAGATLSNVNIYQTSACEVTGTNIKRVVFSIVNSSGQATALNTESGSPWNCNINSKNFADGAYTLRAVAYDATSGGASATATRSITIKNNTSTTTPPPPTSGNTPPVVTFSKPANGATVAAGPVACAVTATDADGIAKLEWFLDGKLTFTETSAPFDYCQVNTTGLTGAHVIKARATDKKGATTEAEVTVNVGGTTTPPPPSGNTPPVVTFSKPANGATVAAGPVACAVTATDADGIASLAWFLDGKPTYTELNAPFDFCQVNTTGLTGAHVIKAVATDKKGAQSEAQVTVNVGGSTTPPPPPPPPAGSIDPADIVTGASADVLFAQQPNIYADILGSSPWMSTVPESGSHGTMLPNGETLRFGKEVDPLNTARKALTFQLAPSDPTTGGSKRTEIGFPRNIQPNQVYWIALSIYVHDWGTLSTSDQSLFGFQLHSGTKIDLSPTIALYTASDGRSMQFHTRYSTSTSPSQSNSVTTKWPATPIPFGRWMDVVVKFKTNTSGSGFAQIWLDGNQVVNHTGNLGFNTPGTLDFVKFGYYNWTSAFATPRKVRLRQPTVVADPTGSKYNESDLRGLLGASGGNIAGTSSTISSTGGTTTTASTGGVCSSASCVAAQ